MFILILQFFWLYIDDLMGKGLGVFIILELLFYVSASLIPLALPLAILLSSLMTFGNLSENNELTALKSSGLSLYRIIRPLFFVVLIVIMFIFASSMHLGRYQSGQMEQTVNLLASPSEVRILPCPQNCERFEMRE